MATKFVGFIKKEKYISIYLLLLTIVTYGFELTNWTLTIDEEIHSHREKVDFARAWIGDGRFGISLLKLILPTDHVLPFFNGFLSLVILFLIGLLFVMFFSNEGVSKWISCIGASFFITSPILSYYLMFDTFSVELSIGIGVSLIAAILYYKGFVENRKYLFGAIALLVFTISIYQSLFQCYAVLICGIAVVEIVKGRNFQKIKTLLLYYIGAVVNLCVSLGIYAVINKVLQDRIYKYDYVDGYFRWSYWDVMTCISEIKNVYRKLYLFFPEPFFEGGEILYFIYIAMAISLILYLIKDTKNILTLIISYIGIIVSTCCIAIAMGGPMPLRSYQSIGVMCALDVMFFLDSFSHLRVKKIVVAVCIVASLYQRIVSSILCKQVQIS